MRGLIKWWHHPTDLMGVSDCPSVNEGKGRGGSGGDLVVLAPTVKLFSSDVHKMPLVVVVVVVMVEVVVSVELVVLLSFFHVDLHATGSISYIIISVPLT